MEGNANKYSIGTWRNKKKEKKNANKKEYYTNNQEKLAEKARERMKRLREKRIDHAHNALWVMFFLGFFWYLQQKTPNNSVLSISIVQERCFKPCKSNLKK